METTKELLDRVGWDKMGKDYEEFYITVLRKVNGSVRKGDLLKDWARCFTEEDRGEFFAVKSEDEFGHFVALDDGEDGEEIRALRLVFGAIKQK